MKSFLFTSRPEGMVSKDNYTLVTEPIPSSLSNGEVLFRALFLSVDPYMRIQQASSKSWEAPHPLNVVQGGGAVGVIDAVGAGVTSVKVGDEVYAYSGWRTHAVLHESQVKRLDSVARMGAPITTALGALGMPGRTAWFGLMDKGRPCPGDVVVVSGAAGAVGSLVVQLAVQAGTKVVAIAGSQDKLDYVKSIGAHVAITYNQSAEALLEAIKAAAPGGVNVYFDNAGGAATDCVLQHLAVNARVVICGQISSYNSGLDSPEQGPRLLHQLIYTRATISGVLARDYVHREAEQIAHLAPMIKEGRLKTTETIVEGFERLPEALQALFTSKNTGKMLVKV
jgi:NADPH-dependent curcumin reductase CurA